MVDRAILLPSSPDGTLFPQEKGWETSSTPLSLEVKKPREFGIVKKGKLESSHVSWKERVSAAHSAAEFQASYLLTFCFSIGRVGSVITPASKRGV